MAPVFRFEPRWRNGSDERSKGCWIRNNIPAMVVGRTYCRLWNFRYKCRGTSGAGEAVIREAARRQAGCDEGRRRKPKKAKRPPHERIIMAGLKLILVYSFYHCTVLTKAVSERRSEMFRKPVLLSALGLVFGYGAAKRTK